MCGIVGYIGPRDATPIILNGLKRLEYRGYDSAGLALINDGQLDVRKNAGKLSQLIDLLYKSPIHGAPGMGHTRWATHAAPASVTSTRGPSRSDHAWPSHAQSRSWCRPRQLVAVKQVRAEGPAA